MPLDETKPAETLEAEHDLTRVEKQNRYGMKSLPIRELPAGKHTTIIVVETDREMTNEEYYVIDSYLKQNHGVSALQTAFSVQNIREDGFSTDLHLTAHMRFRPIPPVIDELHPPDEQNDETENSDDTQIETEAVQ